MITLTFAGDEAGDVSFNFAKGASRFFVTTLIATQSPESLRQLLATLRKDAKLPENYEFKFHRTTSESIRERVFTTLAKADFEAWSILADKLSLPMTFRAMNGLEFYLYFVTELISAIPVEKLQNATLILDEFSSTPNMRNELRRIMDARGIPRQFKRVIIRESKSESLIQVADLVAGAILRRDTKHDSGAYDLIARKINDLIIYRPD
jgi:hypothetical protein